MSGLRVGICGGGPGSPHYTGLVSYRSLVAGDGLAGRELSDPDYAGAFVKWWGPTVDQEVDQGACMAIEDAGVLARSLESAGRDDIADRLRVYEAIRRDRTALVQRRSAANDWMKTDEDPTWLYGHDAWCFPLAS